MSECLFCKIIAGEIPSKKVYEDEWCYAFDDIEPEAPVHTLVVPKQHFKELNEEVPADVLAHLMIDVARVARIKGVAESGYRVILNVGPDSAQSVEHMHAHVIGGVLMSRATFENSWRRNPQEKE